MFLDSKLMDTNQYVKEFLNSEDPSKELIVNAYVVRDKHYNIDSEETRFKHMKKLGYTLDQINEYQKRKQEEYVMNYMRTMYTQYQSENMNFETNFEDILQSYQNSIDYQIVQNTVNQRTERFNVLSALINSPNYDFYNALTSEELYYLGW